MKTRIIKTGIYSNEKMLSLTPDVRFICIYLYTNSHIGLIDIYKVPVQLIQLETGYDITTIKIVLDKLQDIGVIKHFNYLWIQLTHSDFASLVYSGEKNENAIVKYISEIPKEIKDFFKLDTSIDSTIYTSIHTSYKSEIINNKSEIKNNKSINTSTCFDRFWEVYPKKEMKKKTHEIWIKNKLDKNVDEIVTFIQRAKNTERWDKGFIKQPTTFLNNESWKDDLSAYGIIKKEKFSTASVASDMLL